MKRRFLKIGICFIALIISLGSSFILLASEGLSQVTEKVLDVKIVKDYGIHNLYPGVYTDENLALNADGLWGSDVKNAVTHEIKIKNTGNMPAKVKVIIAFEQGNLSNEEFEKLVFRNINRIDWTWDEENKVYGLEMDGTQYMAISATYNHELFKETVTTASLKQILLSRETKNEDICKIDGNGNGTYDIRIKSQSCETSVDLNNVFSSTITKESFTKKAVIEDKSILINYE